MSESLQDRIKRHEGFDPNPYPDAGGQSIGYGCRLPLTVREAEVLFDSRYGRAIAGARRVLKDALASDLSMPRWGVIVEMCFQLGERGTRRFKRMLAALADGEFEAAATELLDSDVARKQPGRWGELAAIMRTGEAP